MVLWEGRLAQHRRQGGSHVLVLQTDSGPVTVTYAKGARNLEHDRSGFRVALKGKVQVKEGKVVGLEGFSAILLEPPPDWSYERYLARWSPPPGPGLYPFLCWWVSFHNPQETSENLAATASGLVAEADRNGLDPLFFAALVQVESAFDQDAVSSSGALGLGQLMPGTAEGLGVDPHDRAANLKGSAQMLGDLVRQWSGTPNPRASALAGYNAGPNLVASLGGQVPAYSQTTNYVYFIGYVHRRMTDCARRCGALARNPPG
jgi:hypothetical protein